MPSAAPAQAQNRSAAPDDLDNLFNYDDAVEDFLKDLPIEKDQNGNTTRDEPSKNIDEEITIKKKRKPVPKLDESLLMSQKGLPRLRKITKSRLKFRGKGHEFSDMSKLLDTYQLWLDELYPRVKFRDGLAMVEKLGHTRRLQVMRRAWLDDTKPSATASALGPEQDDEVAMSGALPTEEAEANGEGDDSVPAQSGLDSHARDTQQLDNAPDDDELDALMADNDPAAKESQSRQRQQKQKGPFDEDEDEDELDALLAEQSALDSRHDAASKSRQSNVAPQKERVVDDFADEEEAMADMGMW